MLELHGFKCSVLCDDEPLKSYDATVADRGVSGWIASEVGREFMIRIEQSATAGLYRPHYTIRIEIDGREVDYMCVGPEEYTVKGIRPTPTTFATLRFAALRTTDEGSADEKASADLGTIRVKVSRVIRTGLGQLSTVIRSPPAAATVHERNKKHVLGGQSISTGSVVSIPAMNTVTILPYSASDPTPYVVFTFKYRSRAFLEAQDIIPREKVKTMPPPQPSPASSSATAVSFSAISSNARKRARASGSGRGSTLGFEEDEDVKPADKRARLSLDLERRVRELKSELRNLEAELGHTDRRETIIDLTADDDDESMMPPPPPRRRAPKVKREPVQTSPLRITEDGIIDLT